MVVGCSGRLMFSSESRVGLDAINCDAPSAHAALSLCCKFALAHVLNVRVFRLQTICDAMLPTLRGHLLATKCVQWFGKTTSMLQSLSHRLPAKPDTMEANSRGGQQSCSI